MNSIYILHVIMFTAMSNESMKEENELRIKFLVYKFIPMENIDISQLLVTSKLCFGYFPWNLLVISLTCLKTDLETPLQSYKYFILLQDGHSSQTSYVDTEDNSHAKRVHRKSSHKGLEEISMWKQVGSDLGKAEGVGLQLLRGITRGKFSYLHKRLVKFKILMYSKEGSMHRLFYQPVQSRAKGGEMLRVKKKSTVKHQKCGYL